MEDEETKISNSSGSKDGVKVGNPECWGEDT